MDPLTLQTIGIFLSPVIIVAVMIQLNNVTNKRIDDTNNRIDDTNNRIDILTGEIRSMVEGITARIDRMDDKISHRFDLLEDKFTRHLEQHSATMGDSSSSQKEN